MVSRNSVDSRMEITCFPRICRTGAELHGVILQPYVGGRKVLRLLRSSDEGAHWTTTHQLAVPLDSSYPLISSDGNKVLVASINTRKPSLRVLVTRSTDQGRSWSRFRAISIDGGNRSLSSTGVSFVSGVGWVLPVWSRRRSCFDSSATPQSACAVYVSSDGLDWKLLCSLPGDYFSQPTVLMLKNGCWMAMLVEAPEQNEGRFYQSISSDAGASWSMPVDTGMWGQAPQMQEVLEGLVVLAALDRYPRISTAFTVTDDILLTGKNHWQPMPLACGYDIYLSGNHLFGVGCGEAVDGKFLSRWQVPFQAEELERVSRAETTPLEAESYRFEGAWSDCRSGARGYCKRSEDSSASVSADFDGTGILLHYDAGPSGILLDVRIDEEQFHPLEMYSPEPVGDLTACLATGLAPGLHTVELRRHPASDQRDVGPQDTAVPLTFYFRGLEAIKPEKAEVAERKDIIDPFHPDYFGLHPGTNRRYGVPDPQRWVYDYREMTLADTSVLPGRVVRRFPRIARLRGGTLVVTFTEEIGHMHPPSPQTPKGSGLLLIRSEDGGASWSRPEVLLDTVFAEIHAPMTQLSDGTVLCTFLVNLERYGFEHHAYRTYAMRSVDGAKSWTEPVLVPTPAEGSWYEPIPPYRGSGLTTAAAQELPDGRIVLPIAHHGTVSRPLPLRCSYVVSSDRGRSWDKSVTFAADEDHSIGFVSPWLIRLRCGRWLAYLRTADGGGKDKSYFALYRVVSEDEGVNWSAPEKIQFTGRNCCLLELSTGPLLLAVTAAEAKPGLVGFGEVLEQLPYRDPVTALSTDSGATWEILPGVYSGYYPSLAEGEPGEVVAVGGGWGLFGARYRVRSSAEENAER
jgi:hypothetical protein